MAKKNLKIRVDNREIITTREAYIAAKTKQLKEFGYGTLTHEEVGKSLDRALAGKATDIISMFIDEDLVTEE